MVGEACIAAFGDVFFHAEAGQCDGWDIPAAILSKLADEIDSGT